MVGTLASIRSIIHTFLLIYGRGVILGSDIKNYVIEYISLPILCSVKRSPRTVKNRLGFCRRYYFLRHFTSTYQHKMHMRCDTHYINVYEYRFLISISTNSVYQQTKTKKKPRAFRRPTSTGWYRIFKKYFKPYLYLFLFHSRSHVSAYTERDRHK